MTFGAPRFDDFFGQFPKQLAARIIKKLDVIAASYVFVARDDVICATGAVVAFTIFGHIDNLDVALSGNGWGVSTKGMAMKSYTMGASDFSDESKLKDYSRIEKYLEKSSCHLATIPNIQPISADEIDRWKKLTYSCEKMYPDEPTLNAAGN